MTRENINNSFQSFKTPVNFPFWTEKWVTAWMITWFSSQQLHSDKHSRIHFKYYFLWAISWAFKGNESFLWWFHLPDAHCALRSCSLIPSVCRVLSPACKSISIAGIDNLAPRLSEALGTLTQLHSQRLLLDTWYLLTKSFAACKAKSPTTWQTKPPNSLLCSHRCIHDFSCHWRHMVFPWSWLRIECQNNFILC